jgi:hypothetical protein
MKTLFISLFLYLSFQLNASELTWVDAQIKAIKPPRIGLNPNKLTPLKDPFLFVKSKDTAKKKPKASTKLYRSTYKSRRLSLKRLHLTMIMNKSAKINGKWYKVNEKIRGYTIVNIKSSKVILGYHKKHYTLSTDTENKKLNFKN